MGKIVIGPIKHGIKSDVKPFNIDNDSFPVLINAYQWRDRVKRKRGTEYIGRLHQFIGTTSGAGAFSYTFPRVPLLYGASQFVVGSSTLTDPSPVSGGDPVTLLTTGTATGTLNRATGALVIANAAINTAVYYYPGLPVMGLEPFVQDTTDNPQELGFDTTYSYNISLSDPYPIYGVNYYNNPTTATYPGYVQKGTWTALNWNMQDYQQIWTTNYAGALWSTPGIESPYGTGTHIGMQFKPITGYAITVAGPPAATATIKIVGHGLSIGDFLFINEVGGITGTNFQTCYVIAPAVDADHVNVEFPLAALGGAYTSGGIAQYLTNNSDRTKDCIRWFNGDPINDINGFQLNAGWVNFCPPIVTGNNSDFYVGGSLAPGQYYLVGARMIIPYKDRLLFLGPVVQTSASGTSPVYLQDTIIYSWNGTPYYTVSFNNAGATTPSVPNVISSTFQAILVPTNQSANPFSFVENANGFGGFITAGFARPITSVSPNEDALIVGFADRQARVLYTGNDALPFAFYIINSELGSDSTFSTITLDRGVLSVGGRGIIMTSQISSQRIDLDIIDEIFQLELINQGSRRVCAQRDFQNEWVQFTVPYNTNVSKYPTVTLQYNYREDTWGMFTETFTTYGTVRFKTGETWASWTNTWDTYNDSWGSGITTLLQPILIGGTQQGFILKKGVGTGEGTTLFISNISATTVTCIDHALPDGTYIVISGVAGSAGTPLNGKIFQITQATEHTFTIQVSTTPGTYTGGGLITRMYVPYIQTKQFPVAWGEGKKTRIGYQQYLLSKTDQGRCTLLIFLSQNSASAYNQGPIVPDGNSKNNSLIYTTVLSTSPEYQTRSVKNGSLGDVGDGSATTYSFNYDLLFDLNGPIVTGTVTLTIGTVATFTDNGDGTLTGTGTGTTGTISYTDYKVVINFSVAPTDQTSKTNFDTLYPWILTPTAAQQEQIWHRVNTSLIGDTVQLAITFNDAQMTDLTFPNQFNELELHSIIIDVNPSQFLA